MIRCMAPIVPPGAFMNQLHPNPHTLFQKNPQQRNYKNSVEERKGERERERESWRKGHISIFFQALL